LYALKLLGSLGSISQPGLAIISLANANEIKKLATTFSLNLENQSAGSQNCIK
jgi:hypothetical protein